MAEPRLQVLLESSHSIAHRGPANASQSSSLNLPPLQAAVPPYLVHNNRLSPLEPSTSATADEAHPGAAQLTSTPSHVTKRATSKKAAATGPDPPSTARRSSPARTTPPRAPLVLSDVLTPAHQEDTRRGPSTKRAKRDAEAPTKSFVQLPEPPPKKTRPPPTTTAIPSLASLSALKTPPPNAALFPPIASDVFDDVIDGAFLMDPPSPPRELCGDSPPKAADDDRRPNTRPNATRSRKKWEQQETEDLLHGVALYGIGNWNKILRDPSYRFNARSSIDLKDRYDG